LRILIERKDNQLTFFWKFIVCSMGQGQAAGTAAALCALKNIGTRTLQYSELRKTLEANNVYFEN
jgi:hypothetical protein